MGISQLISLKTGSSLQPKFRFLRFLGVNHQTLYRPYSIHLLRWLETVRKVLRQALTIINSLISLLSVFNKLLEKLTCLTRDNLFLVNRKKEKGSLTSTHTAVAQIMHHYEL